MAVYVDSARNPLRCNGRILKMSHLLADSLEELHAMADRVGLKREWFQADPMKPHYDLCQTKRELAIQAGAIVIDRRETVTLLRRLRAAAA